MLKEKYLNINELVDDIHELSVQDTLISMDILSDKEFRGQFISCPFHDGDKTPSMQITNDFFKCYGCGKKGDLIKFIEYKFRIPFMESVIMIAKHFNVEISNVKYKYDDTLDKLKEQWDNYLKNMDNAPNIIKNMAKDYYPLQVGFDKDNYYLVLAYTSKIREYPPVGFTKRRIDIDLNGNDISEKNKNKAKWIHSASSESLLMEIHNIFNLYTANQFIEKEKEIILTEGPKDTIAFMRINKKNVIATSGTSNSNNIWNLILPVENIVLSMDGDSSGIKSTLSMIKNLSSFFDIKNVTCCEFLDGNDPYDNRKNLKSIYDSRISAIEYVVKYGDQEYLNDLYRSILEYNKFELVKEISKVKLFSYNESVSFLTSFSIKKYNNSNVNSEKEKLLDIVNNGVNETGEEAILEIKKAKRILKMKYKIDLDKKDNEIEDKK